ncbi:Splicing factor 1 [Perkinsus olseni]|uniref:Branchpoint-bridging protein n=2 Tax=Perkinsus olseni TaxID=32597 RepID=A0A7J6PCJ4_PEROL|nr:Splicing factor 1 [Perkinsus olseni]
MIPWSSGGASEAIVPLDEGGADQRRRGLDFWEPSGWSGGQLVVVDDDTRGRGQMAVYGTIGPAAGGRGRAAHKRRRLHLGPKEEIPYRPRPLVDLPVGFTISEVDQLMREIRLEDLRSKVANKELELADEDVRAPSPPPVYNSLGQKINTRELRVKHQMHDELNRLCHYMIKTVPNYVPPPEYRPPKYVQKVLVPVKRYPTENFMGILIGPRGCNHRLLKEILDCDITLRGRGTGKHSDFVSQQQSASSGGDRSSTMASWQAEEDASLPLHVHISGDDEDRVQEAVEFIKKCLTPGSREYEALQSRGRDTLAVINGTVGIGSNYHQRQLRVLEADGLDEIERWRAVARHVRCEICGDRGHPTVDCPQRRMPSHDELMEDWRLDKEYHDLMASVSPEASPSSDGQPPSKRQHTSQQEEEILSPPELPPMPLPPPMEATPKVPAPLQPMQQQPSSSSSPSESPANSSSNEETSTGQPTTPHVPRPLAAQPRRQRRPLAPHPLRTIPMDPTPPPAGPYHAEGPYPFDNMGYATHPPPHGYSGRGVFPRRRYPQ